MKNYSLLIFLTLNLTLTVNGYFNMGACPSKYRRVKNPFGLTGEIPNGLYYSHYIDT
jgi:hypothetical protein